MNANGGRHVSQVRPGPNSQFYTPMRDLVNLYMPMMQELLLSLDENQLEGAFEQAARGEKPTAAQLGTAVEQLVRAIDLFVRDPSIKSPQDAYTKAGFVPESNLCVLILFAKLGMILTGGFFVALRDVTFRGETSNYDADLATMVAAGRQLHNLLQDIPLNSPAAVDRQLADIAELAELARAQQQAIEDAKKEVRRTEQLVADKTLELEQRLSQSQEAAAVQMNQLLTVNESQQARLTVAHAVLQRFKLYDADCRPVRLGFWSRICIAWRVLWNLR